VPIFIDPTTSLSYISPKIVDLCHLQDSKFKKPWLVQLTTGEKRRVVEKMQNCPIELVGQPINIYLNVFPTGVGLCYSFHDRILGWADLPMVLCMIFAHGFGHDGFQSMVLDTMDFSPWYWMLRHV